MLRKQAQHNGIKRSDFRQKPFKGRRIRLNLFVIATSFSLVTAYVVWIWTLEPLTGIVGNTSYNVQVFGHSTACDSLGSIEKETRQTWQWIDKTLTKDYPKERVSGGIFLYPRQAALLVSLTKYIQRSLNRQVTVCETGFGSGHSMALFAHAGNAMGDHNEPLRILSFDKFDRQYQRPMWEHLNATLSKSSMQYRLVAGDSCKTVPLTLSQPGFQCDILHGSSLCASDNLDLVEYSPCGVLLTSTAMSSLTDRAVYFGPKAQWRKLRERGCITAPICFQEELHKVDREFVFAKEVSSHQSKFCIAITTGKCQKARGQGGATAGDQSCSSELSRLLFNLELARLCPNYQVLPPP